MKRSRKKIIKFCILLLIDLVMVSAIVGGYYYFGIYNSEHGISEEDRYIIDIEPENVIQPEVKTKNIEYLTWTEKFIDKFSEEALYNEYSYQDQHVNISITKYETGSGNDKISYYVSDIYVASIEYFRTKTPSDNTSFSLYATPAVIYKYYPSNILICNGDYTGSGYQGLIVRNGEVLRNQKSDNELCVIGSDGVMNIYSANSYTQEDAVKDKVWQTWVFGPSLLRDDGSAKEDNSEFSIANWGTYNNSSYLLQEHPRAGIGYYEPGHYCIVIVDGRDPGYSKGVTLLEFSKIFESLGCVKAYNLDGGGSAQMFFNGNSINHIISGRGLTDFIVVDIDPSK